MRAALLSALSPLLSSLGACGEAPAPHAAPVLVEEGEFRDAWEAAGERVWPGADWAANRVQDWRVADGELRCTYGAGALAGRTAHLLTRRIPVKGDAPFEVEVTLLPLPGEGAPGALAPGSAAGLLLGVGGPGIDPRASALVQQVPAPGGGVLLCWTREGLSLLDFSRAPEGGGNWTLPGNVDFEALPRLLHVPCEHRGAGALRLRATWSPLGGGTLGLVLADARGAWRVEGALPCERGRVAGGVALFSARGLEGTGGGFAFRDFRLAGSEALPERAFGPVLGVLYTVDRDGGQPGGATPARATLRLTAQLPPLEPRHVESVRLRLELPGGPREAEGRLATDGSFTVPFEVRGLDPAAGGRFEVDVALADGSSGAYAGSVRPEPGGDRPLVLATLSCVKNQVGPPRWDAEGLWFPHADLVAGVRGKDPDLLFFAGDQIYEGDVTPPDTRSAETLLLDYHTKWQRFLWAFGELTRAAPAVVIPDDHDVYHGNLWGAGGRRAEAREGVTAQDAGGYKHPAAFVNAVHATQTSHLPPTRVTPRIGQGITTYTTRLAWGGIDACILADRMWKDSPTTAVPAGDFRNGWPQAEGFDPRDADVPGAELLGPEQEAFLAAWVEDPAPGTWARVVLSQSPFACLHTLPASESSDAVVGRLRPPAEGEYPPDDRPVPDADSNGWPQAARSRAVALFARAGALHLAGDQHVGTTAWYGVEGFRDGTVVFTNPAVANAWPRRWMPAEPGAHRAPGAPRHTGDYEDAFGNRVTMLAVANPRATSRAPVALNERAPGYGIVRFDPRARTITLEAWPRGAGVERPYAGWPIVLGADARPRER